MENLISDPSNQLVTAAYIGATILFILALMALGSMG